MRSCIYFSLYFSWPEIRNQAAKFGRFAVRMLGAASLLLFRFCCCEFYTCNLFQETPWWERNYVKLSKENVFCKLTFRYCRFLGLLDCIVSSIYISLKPNKLGPKKIQVFTLVRYKVFWKILVITSLWKVLPGIHLYFGKEFLLV